MEVAKSFLSNTVLAFFRNFFITQNHNKNTQRQSVPAVIFKADFIHILDAYFPFRDSSAVFLKNDVLMTTTRHI